MKYLIADRENAALPTVAVFMAVYEQDRVEWADAALASVLRQHYPTNNIHVYLGIDGPLPPALAQWVDSVSSSLYCVVRSMQRRGLAATLNALLQKLGGEHFVFRMDSDDICLPDRFKSQIDYLLTHQEVGIVGTAIEEMDEFMQPRATRFYPPAKKVRQTIGKLSPLAHPTVCFRAEVLRKLNGYPLSGFNEDIVLWFRAISMGIVIDNIPQVHLRYRLGSGTFKRRGWKKAFGEFTAYVCGIWQLHGITWLYVYPVLRLGLRLMPQTISKLAYKNVDARNRLGSH